MFLVLLEVCVDKEAPSGVNKRVLDVVNTLIPARGQRGGSRGYLERVWGTNVQGDFSSTFTFFLIVKSLEKLIKFRLLILFSLFSLKKWENIFMVQAKYANLYYLVI